MRTAERTAAGSRLGLACRKKRDRERPKECCGPAASKCRFRLASSSCVELRKNIELLPDNVDTRLIFAEPLRIELLGDLRRALNLLRPASVRHPLKEIWHGGGGVEVRVVEFFIPPHATVHEARADEK